MERSDVENDVFNEVKTLFENEHSEVIKKSAAYKDIVEDAKLVVALAKKKLKNSDHEWFDEVATKRHLKQLDSAYGEFESSMNEVAKRHRRAEQAYDDIVEVLKKHFD